MKPQLRINPERQGQSAKPVLAVQFNCASTQAGWISAQIQSWLQQGVSTQEIAVLARQWDLLDPVRALLEKTGISTYALKNDSIPLVRNWVAVRLISTLKAERDRLLAAEESVQDWFRQLFHQWQRNVQEPTVQMLLKIGASLDQERGYGSEDMAVAISADEILTAIFELNQSLNQSGEAFLKENSVLVTSCHGAKGLEFRKVILLTDEFSTRSHEIESERRLFYVAMTRAKEELMLCSTQNRRFAQEAQLHIQQPDGQGFPLSQQMLYLDLTPKDVNLGHRGVHQRQLLIKTLQEGELLKLTSNAWKNGWDICTIKGSVVGALSKAAVDRLRHQGIHPDVFQFQSGEVRVRSIYQHLKTDEVTNKILEDWSVVIPQIRIYR